MDIIKELERMLKECTIRDILEALHLISIDMAEQALENEDIDRLNHYISLRDEIVSIL